MWTAEQIIDWLDVGRERVMKALEDEGLRKCFFPNAEQDAAGAWHVPDRDMRAFLGPDLPRLYTIADFALLIGRSVPWIHELVRLQVIKHRLVLGIKMVPEGEYWNLPAERPACLRDRAPKEKAA